MCRDPISLREEIVNRGWVGRVEYRLTKRVDIDPVVPRPGA